MLSVPWRTQPDRDVGGVCEQVLHRYGCLHPHGLVPDIGEVETVRDRGCRTTAVLPPAVQRRRGTPSDHLGRCDGEDFSH